MIVRIFKVVLMLFYMTSYVQGISSNETIHWEQKLYNDLMQGYNKNIKPVKQPHGQITVHVYFSLGRIESLDEKDQVLTTFGWMSLIWTDEILNWNPADYGGLNRMVLNGKDIWIPEIAMLNSVDQGTDVTLTTESRASVLPWGQVMWAPGFKWRTSCQINLRYFPYDAQICEVQFINWVYGSLEVNLTNLDDYVDISYFIPNPGWDLISTAVGRRDDAFSEEFILPQVAFQLRLKRKPTFFMVNLVIPALIMTFMSLMVFCLPSASGEKVSMSITNLLSYSVMLLMMSDITPKSSDTTPYITIYIILSMGISALALVCTVVVLTLYHHSQGKPMPAPLKSFILRGLACLLLMRRSQDKTPVENAKVWANKIEPNISVVEPHLKKERNAAREAFHGDLAEYARNQTVKERESEIEESNRKDWEAAARVVDRFFFVVFAVFILGMICVVIVSLLGNNDTGHIEGFPYIVN